MTEREIQDRRRAVAAALCGGAPEDYEAQLLREESERALRWRAFLGALVWPPRPVEEIDEPHYDERQC